MRKVLALLLSILLLAMLSACSSAPAKPADIVFAFTCSAQVKIGEDNVSCTITRAAPQSASITISSPQEVKGMTYTWGDSFAISYAGLVVNSKDCTLPQPCFAPLLIQVLDAASKENALTRVSDSEFSGKFQDGSFKLTVDNANGHIQQIEIPQYGIYTTLDHFKAIT